MKTTPWFEKVVGKENLSESEIDKHVYSTDSSQIQGKANKILWVTTPKQAQEIVLYAKRHNMNIVPRGAGTSLSGNTIPINSLIIDFTKMNKILKIEDDYVIVEPGVVLDDLNNALKDKFLPIVPEDSSVCTIGGMIGINSSGIYEKKFGKIKDWVLGIEMINGVGRVKQYNNEIVGTEGILGLITKIKLRLAPKIYEKSLDVLKYNKIAEVVEKVSSLKGNREAIAVEYISKMAAQLIGLESKYHLIVEYSDQEGDSKDLLEIERIWNIRKNVFPKLAQNDYTILQDPFIPLDNMAEFLYWCEKSEIPCFGPLGVSVVHPCLKNRETIQEITKIIKKLKGNLGSRFGIGILNKDFLTEIEKESLKKIKKEHDPTGIMNRGKVI